MPTDPTPDVQSGPDTETPDRKVGGAHADDRIDIAEKMARIVELRRRRMTFQQIGDELGHSRQWVHELYERALKGIPAADVQAHRIEMLDQLDEAEAAVLAVLTAHHVVVSNGHVVSEIIDQHPMFTEDGREHPKAGEPIYGDPLIDHGPVLDAARTLVALQARKAKLLGADAPTQVETTQTVTTYNVDLGDGAREAMT